MTPEPQPERCRAILKSVYLWRCHRRGYGADQLCAQHRHFGCKVPVLWVHRELANGVDSPRPEGRWTAIPKNAEAVSLEDAPARKGTGI